MPCQLPSDCLNEIFENLEQDRISLHSCLLVNRLWCEVSVRILWRDIWSFKYNFPLRYQLDISSQILSTLIACLPKVSKELLYENEIFISKPTLKPPLFNYTAFCQALSIYEVDQIIHSGIKNQQITSSSLNYNKYLITQEIIKMFMAQISSLKTLTYFCDHDKNIPFNINFTYFPGARDCLTELSGLCCGSDIYPEIFYQLSQICHNLHSLTIEFNNYISSGLADLISLQNNLRHLTLRLTYDNDIGYIGWAEIIPSLKKLSTLTKLNFNGGNGGENYVPLLFIASYSNIRELTLSFVNELAFEEFEGLQNVTFPNLRILKIPFEGPKAEIIMKFLENNGKNLIELNMDGINNLAKLSIAKFCPNLKKIFVIFKYDELNILETIFKNCQYLERINVWCSVKYLNEKELLKVIAKYSPTNFYELKIYNEFQSELLPEDLESFFISWQNRTQKKSLRLIFIMNGWNNLDINQEKKKIIEKYKNLGVVGKFGTEIYNEED